MKELSYGDVFKLESLIDYEKGKAVKKMLFSNDGVRVLLISFDDDSTLAEHTAPGNALIYALKGKAVLTYEGKEFKLKEGDSFAMSKGALHSIHADEKFKMALTIIL